jgi:16S rRNA (uracil1498-N3)-methyltransferase
LPKTVEVRVSRVEKLTAPATRLSLVQALAKGDRDELAVQAATELGVLVVIPWQADRSVSRWDSAKATKGRERWQSICDEAAKQSLRGYFPQVEPAMTSAELTAATKAGQLGRVFVLDPTSALGLDSALNGEAAGEISFVVGPEGGISATELENFESAGAIRVHLGTDILRTSTAGMAAIAVLNSKLGTYR